MNIYIYFKGKKISTSVKQTNFFIRGLGLTFRTRDTKNLLFEFNREVTWQGNLTSLFVFFPFLTIWLDQKNKVLDYRVINPFVLCIKQNKKFRSIIEIPINNKNKSTIVRFIVNKNYKRYFRR